MSNRIPTSGSTTVPSSTTTKQPVTASKPPTAPVPVPSSSQTGPAHEKIAMRAYQKWVQRGRQQGNEHQDWLEAEAELKREMGSSSAPSQPRR